MYTLNLNHLVLFIEKSNEKYLHAITGSTIVMWPAFNDLRKLLCIINEHAAHGRFNRHHNYANQYLNDP